jgi:hypothetical protein
VLEYDEDPFVENKQEDGSLSLSTTSFCREYSLTQEEQAETTASVLNRLQALLGDENQNALHHIFCLTEVYSTVAPYIADRRVMRV